MVKQAQQPLPGQGAPLHAGQAVRGPTAGSWGHGVSGELHTRFGGHSDTPAGRRGGRVLTAARVSGGGGQCSAEKTEGGLAAALTLARSRSRDQSARDRTGPGRDRGRGSSAQRLGVK